MLIIDKNNDFYDHFSYIYGIDKKVVFDRRGSFLITDEDISKLGYWEKYEPEFFLILEVGFVQYLIRVHSFETEKQIGSPDIFKSCKMDLVREFHENKHFFPSPISINTVGLDWYFSRKDGWSKRHYKKQGAFSEVVEIYDENYRKHHEIKLPILKDTQLTSIIDGDLVWKELQNYISSLNNDKSVDLGLTDKEKADIHGFDKRSFRNMK